MRSVSVNFCKCCCCLKVVKRLCKGLGVSNEHCVFALFEQCGTIEKNIEDRSILADVLAKFERSVLDSLWFNK